MALDMTSFDAALKAHYTSKRVENLASKDHPLLSMIPKMENFGGKNYPLPFMYGNPQGRSATFATAKANKGASKLEDFVLTRAKDYSLASIDNETIEASKGDTDAFMSAATTEIDGAFGSAGNSLSSAVFRDGTGWIGQVLAEPSETTSTVITLKNIADITQFEVGMVLVAYAATSGGSARTTDGTDDEWAISAIDRDAGTITFAVTYNASGTLAANDYLFVEGDRGSKLKGLGAWIPYVAPGATSFFGVDRTVDVVRMAGVRKDISALPIEEGLIDLAARIGREGGKSDVCVMSFEKFADLEKALGSKVSYVDVKVSADIGFKAIQIAGPKGVIKILADADCPSQYTWMLQLNTWELASLGKAPRILSGDGLKMLRESDADAVEVRVGYYAQLGCKAPGWNGVGYLG